VGGLALDHTDPMGATLVGREEELAAALRLLEPGGPAGLSLVAPPGLGKTALVEAFLEAALAAAVDPAGRAVLHTRPLETEATVAFAGLSDLFSTLPGAAYDSLPPPQRAGLRAALLLDHATSSVDPRAVAAGVRSILEAAPAPGILLVIDDAQWLDGASARALGQALAHVRTGAVRVLSASRPDPRQPHLWNDEQLVLPPLGAAALFHVVQDRLGVVLDRGELRSLERASAGNPLHALELTRARGTVPAGLSDLVTTRLAALPRTTGLGLLAAALADTPVVEVLAHVRRIEPAALLDELEPAREVGLITVLGGRVAFTHPLYAERAVEMATPSDVVDVHAGLADAEPEPDLALRHRALARPDQDATLADALTSAADRVWNRGGWDAACDLRALALDREPDPDRRRDLMVDLGRRLHRAGRPAEAERWLREAVSRGPECWDARLALGHVLAYSGRLDELRPLVDELLAAPLPTRAAAAVRLHLAPDTAGRDPGAQLALVSSANQLLADLSQADGQANDGDVPGLARERAAGLGMEFERRLFMGERRGDLLSLAADLEAMEPPDSVLDSWHHFHAHDLLLGDRHADARDRFEALTRRCAEVGDDRSLPVLLGQWVRLEERAGRWGEASRLLAEGRRSAAGQEQMYRLLFDIAEAKLLALRDDPAAALELVTPSVAVAEALADHGLSAILQRVLGDVHLAAGDVSAAWEALAMAAELEDAAQWRDPGGLMLLTAYAEAGVAVDAVDAVEEREKVVRARAERLEARDNVLAACAYARLALLAGRGDLDAAAGAVPEVLDLYDAPHRYAFERGSALLLAGKVYRRAKAKGLAASTLARAVQVFESLPSPVYAARARDELARVGLRPRASSELTDSEHQVALLASTGLRNREIAARAFVSPRTVEAVLARAYRKLGIRSRAELGRALDAIDRD
jgi:DNA-binding CsgD family transcriptional regulator